MFVVSVDGKDKPEVVRLPKSARTKRQRAMYLLKKGYVYTAYLFAKHSNKVLVSLLHKTNPNVPWKNIHFASKYA